jgi:23S rRNA (cytosine1962-C5)-methyltransferase
MEFKKIILKSGRERSLLNRHPWLFSGAVKQLPNAENGEIVKIETNHKDLLGYGFFSTQSQIVCRIFEFNSEEIEIDRHYWKTKIENALNLRKQLINPAHTTCYRLLHAEGDFFPGLIADVYADVLVLQLLIKGTERISAELFSIFKELGFKYIYLKTKQSTQLLEQVDTGLTWVDEVKQMPVQVLENGNLFSINVETGQKTGFFIDQRKNRQILATYSANKTVLNTFSYSGGFSIYALAAGATLVHSVDSSKDAIALCEENVQISGMADKHESYVSDVFDFLKQAPANFYDIIVLDPPAFAKHSRAVDNAAKGYKNLNKLGFQKVKPGGYIFTYSCSQHIDKDLFRKIVFSAAAETGRNVRILEQLSQPEDHPINIYHPEGEYLKGLLLVVD